jgi:hypothetical protein
MTAEGPREFGIAAESAGDALRVTHLADRVLAEILERAGRDWFEGEARDGARRWRGLAGHEPFFDLHDKTEPRGRTFQLHGDFGRGDEPVDTGLFRRVLLRFQFETAAPIDALVLARDSDHRSDPTAALEAALRSFGDRTLDYRVVLAGASPEIEAWWLCGFEPINAEESTRLQAWRRTLGYSPVERPERLSAGRNDTKADCKRVFKELTGGDVERCLEAPLERLRLRGGNCGLSAFLGEVAERLGPLLGAPGG